MDTEQVLTYQVLSETLNNPLQRNDARSSAAISIERPALHQMLSSSKPLHTNQHQQTVSSTKPRHHQAPVQSTQGLAPHDLKCPAEQQPGNMYSKVIIIQTEQNSHHQTKRQHSCMNKQIPVVCTKRCPARCTHHWMGKRACSTKLHGTKTTLSSTWN